MTPTSRKVYRALSSWMLKTYGNFITPPLATQNTFGEAEKTQSSLSYWARARLWKNELGSLPLPNKRLRENGLNFRNGQKSSVSIPSSFFLNSRRRGENFSSNHPQMYRQSHLKETLEWSALFKNNKLSLLLIFSWLWKHEKILLLIEAKTWKQEVQFY